MVPKLSLDLFYILRSWTAQSSGPPASYANVQGFLRAHHSHRNSVHLYVCHTSGSLKRGAS